MVPSRRIQYNSVLVVFISIFLVSCYTYKPIRISYKVAITRDGNRFERAGKNQGKEDAQQERVLDHDGFDEKNHPPVKEVPQARKYRFYFKKYFARSFGGSPIDRMNNKGVEYALQGRFKEAEILFQEVLTEDKRYGAVLNNLGIIYEIFGHYDKAFRMYAQACLLEPENEHFRKNFLSLKKIVCPAPQ